MSARAPTLSINGLTPSVDASAPRPFCADVGKIAKTGWFFAAAYYLSFEIFVLEVVPSIIGRNTTGTNSSDFNSTQYAIEQAGATLAPVVFYTIETITQAVLFSVNIIARGDRGKIIYLKNQADTEDKQTALQQQIMRLSATVRNGLIIATPLCLLGMLPLYYSADLLILCGQDPAVAKQAQTFLRPSAFAIPALHYAIVLEKVIFSFLHTLASMLIGLSSLLLGTGLATYFYSQNTSTLAGLAYGFLISNYTALLAYAIYLTAADDMREYQFLNFCRLGCKYYDQLLSMLKLGSGMLISAISDNTVSLLLVILAGLMGQAELVKLNNVMNLYFFIAPITAAHAEAGCQEVRGQIKEGDHTGTNLLAKRAIIAMAISALPAGIASIAILGATNAQDNVLADTNFLIFSPVILLGIFKSAILAQLRSLYDNMQATIIDAACMLGGLGLGAAAGFAGSWGLTGLAAGFAAGTTGSFAIMLLWRWLYAIQPEVIEQRTNGKKLKPSCCSCLNSRKIHNRSLSAKLLPETGGPPSA